MDKILQLLKENTCRITKTLKNSENLYIQVAFSRLMQPEHEIYLEQYKNWLHNSDNEIY